MRLGIFGGTFDPVHYGHLLLAETCREQVELDEVWFLPAAVPPHKQKRRLSPNQARLEMLQLALAGHPAMRASPLELERGGLSYTVETLSHLAAQRPEATLFFLMGADSLEELATWREPARICQLAIPLVVARRGAPAPELNLLQAYVSPERLEAIRRCQVTMPVIELSSTDLRQRARQGRSLRYRTPRAVEEYIRTHQLYQTAGG